MFLTRLIIGPVADVSICQETERKFTSNFVQKPIVIDGNLTDWSNADSNIVLRGKPSGSDNCLTIKSCWNNEILYLSFEVIDQDLRAYQEIEDSPMLFLDDMVEVLFDPEHTKDKCWNERNIVYHINLLGVKKDDSGSATCQTNALWNGHAYYAISLDGTVNDTTDLDVGYTIEFGISWAELGVKPVAGLRLGVNFANGDNDGRGRQLFDWVDAWPIRSPDLFGDLILSK